ncbi:DUF2726 domain-containing protein [Methylocaldum sp.]|uniref:DUF2726 domain-containing protein n=1 Tax=Methylocaldum sp. TaxID=1969727 RepID=UPI002D70FC18|nr:DUF2726 domain-containing protein [Methylocaldum sp.]HYE34397.1 DUF2726 domain-containing protein [Methylocaldum sp.]
MNWLILVGIAALAILPLLIRTLSKSTEKAGRSSYRKQDFLFSPEERIFFFALKQAVGEDYEIFGKIPVVELISLGKNEARNGAQNGFAQITDRCVDFILCSKTDLAIACALELHEHSLSAKRQAAPADPLRAICEAAGLPLVRIEAGPLYDAMEIKQTVASAVRKEPLYLIESDGRKEPRISSIEDLEL